MPYRPKDIYRGRRKFKVPLNILLFVLVFLIAGGVAMFFLLQRYMVYDADGATLQLPFGQEEAPVPDELGNTPEPTFEPVQVQVVWEAPDFEDLDMGTWDELAPVQGLFIPYDTLTDPVNLSSYISAVDTGGYSMAVLEMKNKEGQLAWPSTAETAVGYRTYGATDVTSTIEALHQNGKRVAAQISCFSDALLLEHNWTFALRYTDGNVCQGSDGSYWLDPYNHTVRTYLTDISQELAAMGFDEIILADLIHPTSDAGFTYSEQMTTPADPVVAVCQMGRRIVEALEDTETVVSVRLDGSSLRNGQGTQTGQDIEIFWRLFARLYCPTDPSIMADDQALATQAMNGGSTEARFIPVVGAVPDGAASYLIG